MKCRDEIIKMARMLAMKGEADRDPVPGYIHSLSILQQFAEYPSDCKLETKDQRKIERGQLSIRWDRGYVWFGKDSGGAPYDRVRIFYKSILVFDPDTFEPGEWEKLLIEWYNN